MSYCDKYLWPAIGCIVLGVALIVSAFFVTRQQRPHDRRECENYAYQQQAQRQDVYDHNWVGAIVYQAETSASEQMLHDELAACAAIYR